jgi:hypothetical protein
MSVNALTAAFSGYVQKVTSGTSTSSSSAMQEAQETPAVTAKEAAHGDRQAQLKLAREQQQAQQTAPAQKAPKGEIVDKFA